MASFKIGIQTMGNKRHQIDVKESDTVLDVKKKIDNELQLGAADEQKLIHMGRILKDEQTLESVKIKANDVLVVMFSKKKAAAPAPAAPTSSSSSSTPAPTPSVTTAPAPAPTTSASTPSSAPASTPPAAAPAATGTVSATAPAAGGAVPAGGYQQAASALLTGGAREDMIQNLMGLGFPRTEVELALRAAFNNPDRAADYLFNGIPDTALAAAGVNRAGQPTGAPAAAPAAGAAAGAGAGAAPAPAAGAPAGGAASPSGGASAGGAAGAGRGAGAGAGAGGAAGLGALLGAMGGGGGGGAGGIGGDQVRQLLASNPQLIPMLLQQLSQTNPELVQQIQENPAAFLQMLGALGGGAAGGAGGAAGGAGGGGGPRSHVIQVTPEEKQAIDNLESLGFDRHRALEAFLLCDRNYELAANYLFENQAQFAQEDLEAQPNRGAGGGAGGGSGAGHGGDDGEEGDGDDYGDMPE